MIDNSQTSAGTGGVYQSSFLGARRMIGPENSHRVWTFGPAGGWPVAITIPARNEEALIGPCLEAAGRALRGRGGIVLAVNGSEDGTLARARKWFEATGTPGILLDLPAPELGGVGAVRRQAVETCRGVLAPEAAIMTTDADSQVFADWVDRNLSALSHADLICGRVLPDLRESAKLPPIIAERGAIEGEYAALSLAVRVQIDPVPHDPKPSHMSEPGASLAFRRALYDDVGGFPAMPTGEDRAFVAAAEVRGWRVRHSARARVRTSCRLEGRAPNGMADALAGRLSEADPLVDEGLEPAAQTILRARLRQAWRTCLAEGDAAEVARLEARLAGIERVRMRLSDISREMPLLAEVLRPTEPVARERIA